MPEGEGVADGATAATATEAAAAEAAAAAAEPPALPDEHTVLLKLYEFLKQADMLVGGHTLCACMCV